MEKIVDGQLVVNRFEGDIFGANTYVILEGKTALIIDVVDSNEFFSFFESTGVHQVTVFLTHEHFDHISGLNRLREQYNCTVISSKQCSMRIQSSKTNLSSIGDALLSMHEHSQIKRSIPEYVSAASDLTFNTDFRFYWENHTVFCHPMHGHSLGSACYIFDGHILFSGDEILPIPTVTRLPGGNTSDFWFKDIQWLKKEQKKISMTFPGHGIPGDLGAMISGNQVPSKFVKMSINKT